MPDTISLGMAMYEDRIPLEKHDILLDLFLTGKKIKIFRSCLDVNIKIIM